MGEDIEIKDGKMYGGWRAPKNLYRGLKTSIHDESTAKSVGMRGGTIPGTIHLSLFAPLAQKIFSDRWFEKGSVSMYYTFATVDQEEVRAVIEMPPDANKDVQVKAWAEMKNGQVIASGTVGIGNPKEPSYLQSLELKNSPPEDIRILSNYKPGMELEPEEINISHNVAIKGLPGITDRLDFYKGKSPWGKSILSPTAMYGAMAFFTSRHDDAETHKGVPFFGATEVVNVNGPTCVDTPYIARGKIICVGTSRKTEYLWIESTLEEKETGKIVASLKHMNRWMKQGSSLYKELS